METTNSDRFQLAVSEAAGTSEDFAEAVRRGLGSRPKQLPSRFFYDEEGSALFEAICDLPEYYLTRAEREILEARAGEIVESLPTPVTLAELGSGSAVKTRLLIEALLRAQPSLHYVPLDISRTALEASTASLIEDYPTLSVTAYACEYQEGLERLARLREEPKVVLWLGSNIGNLHRDEAAEFLWTLGGTLVAGDRLLIGIDLRKERGVLERAYDDEAGVTARFNLNLLARINRELGGHFDLAAFRHRAVYRELEGRVEMHIVSLHRQRVRIDALDFDVTFDRGEYIHTENSYKYRPAEIDALARVASLHPERRWFDAANRFSLNLLAPAANGNR